MPLPIYWIIIYIVIGVTFGVYLLNAWALSFVDATVVSVYIYLQPILTSMIAITMKQDELSLNKVLLALLIFLGVYLVNYKPSQKKMAAD
jgi:drug/metabolite transporter (DMT)-like permease